MKNIVHTLTQQIIRGFFTSDAAGTKHGDTLAAEFIPVILPPLWKIPKTLGFGVDSALKRTDPDLVIISCVDDDHVILADQIIPVAGFHIAAYCGCRIDIRLTHGHDFFLQPHPHPEKGHVRSLAFLVLQISATRQIADMCQYGVDTLPRPGDSAVDPFARQQERTPDPMPIACRQQWRAQGGGIIEGREFIERGNGKHGRVFKPKPPGWARAPGCGQPTRPLTVPRPGFRQVC